MFQFLHLDAYSRVGNRQTRGGKTSVARSAREIANEAHRIIGFCDHVKNARPPSLVFGCWPQEAVDRAEKWAQTAKDWAGKKLRKDGMCLAAGVISAPRAAVENGDIDWQKFKIDCQNWLQKTYGNRLVSIVQHDDESNPHIHFYCVPLPGEPFDVVHPGLKARNEVRRDKTAKKEAAGIAFRDAMTEFQNDFFKEVSVRHGMVRLGPKRQRLTNSEYKKNLSAAQSVAKTYAILDQKDALSAEIKILDVQVVSAEKTAQNAIVRQQNAEKKLQALEQKIENSTIAKSIVPLARLLIGSERQEIEEAAAKNARKQQIEKDQIVLDRQSKKIKQLEKENLADRQYFQSVATEKNALLAKAKEAEKVPELERKLKALEQENAALKSKIGYGKNGPKGP